MCICIELDTDTERERERENISRPTDLLDSLTTAGFAKRFSGFGYVHVSGFFFGRKGPMYSLYSLLEESGSKRACMGRVWEPEM